ncbi:MAG: hypothetical protein MJ177_00160 [Clostridia bacterium]|nr:hypothetical protein [Clostridia bacterium]
MSSNMDRYEKLLLSWCEYLVKMQNEDGGFRCESCGVSHGRADNAVYPLTFAYAKTGDAHFLKAAERVMRFREKLTCPDGAVKNDFGSEWKGITVFSVINLYKTLHYFRNIIPADFRRNLEVCLDSSSQWVFENIRPGFHSYINYYAAAACADAMYGSYKGNEEYTRLSRVLLSYCMENFTQNGLLRGEGQPHDITTAKGCAAIDIGYNAEESLPCLIAAADILGDFAALEKLCKYAKILLEFMMPDGAWDNSFGARNNKWTYYGSRTADGCTGVFTQLGGLDPVFYEAAKRNFTLLEKCTVDGALQGGRYYAVNGQKPCVHHTFCHACSLTDAVIEGIGKYNGKYALPCEGQGTYIKYFPELDTYKIRCADWYATVTGYDFTPGNYIKGASHASGGSLSMLYHADMGAVIAGSVYDYRRTEPLNMQNYEGETRHSSLIPRVEYEKNGKKYASCFDMGATIKAEKTGDAICVTACSRLVLLADFESEQDAPIVKAEYIFSPDGIKINVKLNKKADGVKFILPIIENTAQLFSDSPCHKEKIFFLTGGFAADEYTFCVQNMSLYVSIKNTGMV